MQDLEKRRLMGEDFDFMALEPELKFVGALIDHTTPHVEILSQDPMRVQQSASFREALNNFTASWKTFINQYQKTLRDQQAKAAAPQGSEQEMGAEGEQPEQESEEQKQTAQKQAMELQMLLEKHRVNNQLKAADVMNKIELRKAEADTKMAIQLREQRLKEQRDAGVTPSPQAQIQTPAVTT
jgi:septal ring factor EnvC (AmiA/AmiB activator)